MSPRIAAARMATSHVVSEDYCAGCGLHFAAMGEHRPDCTADPGPLRCAVQGCKATRDAGARSPVWRSLGAAYLCPDHAGLPGLADHIIKQEEGLF